MYHIYKYKFNYSSSWFMGLIGVFYLEFSWYREIPDKLWQSVDLKIISWRKHSHSCELIQLWVSYKLYLVNPWGKPSTMISCHGGFEISILNCWGVKETMAFTAKHKLGPGWNISFIHFWESKKRHGDGANPTIPPRYRFYIYIYIHRHIDMVILWNINLQRVQHILYIYKIF